MYFRLLKLYTILKNRMVSCIEVGYNLLVVKRLDSITHQIVIFQIRNPLTGNALWPFSIAVALPRQESEMLFNFQACPRAQKQTENAQISTYSKS